MKVTIVTNGKGQVAVKVPEGTFSEGKELIRRVLTEIVGEGIVFTEEVGGLADKVEQHRQEGKREVVPITDHIHYHG
jgi:hypothetical protein